MQRMWLQTMDSRLKPKCPTIRITGLQAMQRGTCDFLRARRFYRYTLVAGIPASHYAGVIEVTPKGRGCVAQWRVQFLVNNQPDIVVRTTVSKLLETGLGSLKAPLRSRGMSTVAEIDRPLPRVVADHPHPCRSGRVDRICFFQMGAKLWR